MRFIRLPLLLFLLVGSLPLAGQRLQAAVGLFNFQAVSVSTGIRLSWQTGFEDNNLGFNLYRATVNDRDQAGLVNPSLIPSQSQGGGGADYDYTDTTVSANVLYYYWVEPVGDSLQNPVPPASATWTTGGGLVTNTPAPTGQPTPTGAPPPTATVTPTVDPSVSPTATSRASSTARPTNTAVATSQPAETAAAGGNGGAGNQPNPTVQSTVADADETAAQPIATSVVAAGTEPTVAMVPEVQEAEPTAIAAVASVDQSAPAANQSEAVSGTTNDNGASGAITAEAIGVDADITLTGSVRESESEGMSTTVLMLLIAGGIFLFGGGATALILLRQKK